MAFDFTLAIAAMPQANGQSSTELLADRYPELKFIFDELEDLRADAIDAETAAADARDDAEAALEGVMDTVAVCRDLIDTIRRMDAANGVKKLLADVSQKLDAEVQTHA